MILVVSFLAALALTPVASRLARRWDAVDRPGPLKLQQESVPYLGGVALFVALVPAFIASRPALLVPALLALGVGVADDASDLALPPRIAAEVGIGFLIALIVPPPLAAPWGMVVVAGATVVLVNAVNLIDGIDGLAAAVTLASAIGFGLALDGDGRLLAAGLVGGLAGFLVFNRPPARIYLGDGGAYLLGVLLTVLLAYAWRPGEPMGSRFASLIFLAVPVTGAAIDLVRRVRARQPVLRGDRAHVYDQLVARGWSIGRTSMTFGVLQFGLCLVGVLLVDQPAAVVIPIVAGVGALLLVAAGASGFLSNAVEEELR